MLLRISYLVSCLGALWLVSQPALADESNYCQSMTAHQLQAEYQISMNGQSSRLLIWRDYQQVLQQLPDKKMATYYYKATPNTLQSIRLFDEFQTGIEYQKNELSNMGRSVASWEEHTQLINDALLKQLRLERVETDECDTLMHYSGELNGHRYKVSWLKKQKLIKFYQDESDQKLINITLIKKDNDPKIIADTFSHYLNFNMVDFADIGDNENDPFIAKMIRQGFIEHGASGFYQANGDPISHNHH